MTVDGSGPPHGSWGSEVEWATIDGHPCRRYRHRHRTLAGFLAEADRFSDRCHLVAGDRRISFGEHDLAVHRAARLLIDRGVRTGDRVLLLGANSPEWIVAFWATVYVGALAVPGNAWWSAEEVAHAVATVDPALAVTDDECRLLLPPPLPTLSAGELRAFLDEPDETDGSPRVPPAPVGEDDPALILFTAGTTGRAKGVTLAHRALIANQQNLLTLARRYPPDLPPDAPPAVSLLSVPLFHISGLQTVVATLLTGGTLLMLNGRFDAGEVLRLIETERITRWGCVPTMVSRVLDHHDLRDRDVSSLRSLSMGGAPVPPELLLRAREAFPAAQRGVGTSYGLSESCGVLTTGQGDDHLSRPNCVGKPMPVVEIRIHEPDPSGLGEILARSPTLVTGYWGNPEEPAVDAEGWLHTGDVGRVDADGYVYVIDRLKDVIIRGGENIAAALVEEQILSHPDVLEVAVVGLPHPDLGQEVAAAVVLREGAEISAPELADHASVSLARFEVPSTWWLREQPLPMSPAGKVLKRELRRTWPSDRGGRLRSSRHPVTVDGG